MSNLYLHIGLKPENFNRFFRQLNGLKIKYTIDGDGWNVWGEGVGVNGNEPEIVHVVVWVDTEVQANEVLALGPLMEYHAEGWNALLTDRDDWGVIYQYFPETAHVVPNELLTDLITLRDYGVGLANEYNGDQVDIITNQVEEAYERLLHTLKAFFKDGSPSPRIYRKLDVQL